MKLFGSVIDLPNIETADLNRMFVLLDQNFVNVQRPIFLRDLAEKDHVIALRDECGKLQGFSTLKFFYHRSGLQSHRIAFSGDTIVSPKHWGSFELPVQIGCKMFEVYNREPKTLLWWLLISKGIRTFKCLPAFFFKFYPNSENIITAEIKELMDSLGQTKFGAQFDPACGLVKPSSESYFLRQELVEADLQRRGDRLSELFLRANPEFQKGTELLCLSQFSPENLRPLILRMINQRQAAEVPKIGVPDLNAA